MFKKDLEIIKDGDYEIDVSDCPFENLTVQVGGDFSNGSIQFLSIVNGARVPFPNGGPFDATEVDAFGLSVQRVILAGRADKLVIKLEGAATPKINVGVR